jgi:hypothetical protein
VSSRPNYRAAGGMPFRPRARAEFSGIDLGKQPVPPEPHPEVGAEVRRLHTWLVESAVYHCGPDAAAIAAAIAAAVYLPLWNVRRALHALGLGPNPVVVHGGQS